MIILKLWFEREKINNQIVIISILGVILLVLGSWLYIEEENVASPPILLDSPQFPDDVNYMHIWNEKNDMLNNIYKFLGSARFTSITMFIIGLILIGISISDYRYTRIKK